MFTIEMFENVGFELQQNETFSDMAHLHFYSLESEKKLIPLHYAFGTTLQAEDQCTLHQIRIMMKHQ